MNLDRDDAIVEYYGDGFSLRETAAHFNISFERVRQIMLREAPRKIRSIGDTRQHSSGTVSKYRSRHR
jgi:DNA-directed RNA polymerase sigma subunit (sigma70/sigma32)